MIRNLIVLDHEGSNLLEVNFGECHSLMAGETAISNFITALHMFGKSMIGHSIRNIRFEHLYFMLLNEEDFLFLISIDDDLIAENRFKLERISELFLEKYSQELRDIKESDNGHDFTEFIDLLIDMNIAQRNCGGNPTCDDCPEHRVLPIERMTDVIRESSN